MCGFVGFTGEIVNRDRIIKDMADKIIHRGPDSDGYYIGPDAGKDTVTLGFRRLSIIDLADGSQPMYNEDGSVVIVYNGETYNFMELRDELIAKGHVFKTRCDTETILHGYEEYGEKIVDKLRGMYAFVVYDTKKKTLFGARDIFGIKPLYYNRTKDGGLIFGSEIKSFIAHPSFEPKVNENALRPYLTFQYSATEETFFKNTFKLPPAHYFTYHEGELRISRYFEFSFGEKYNLPFETMVEMVDSRVRESVNAHRISDVKVGSFLSGGIDSSYITASLMPNDTFSVGFGERKFDETGEAKGLSDILGVKNYLRHLSAEECMDAFDKIQYHMDEPQSNPSSVPLYFLAKLASEHVTVVLSGEGADEIYAGYEWYDDTPAMRKYKKIPFFLRNGMSLLSMKLPYFKGHDFLIKGSGIPERYFVGEALVYPEKEALEVLTEKYRKGISVGDIVTPVYKEAEGLGEVEKKQYLDLKLWLPGDILLKADKMSMAHSIELRVPYLDREVMKEAQRIPEEFKVDGKNTKAVLRAAASRLLPEEWYNRPKKGFPVPIREWVKEDEYYNRIKKSFTSDVASEYFNTDLLVDMLDDHREGRMNNGRKIWTTFTFLTWHKVFFGE